MKKLIFLLTAIGFLFLQNIYSGKSSGCGVGSTILSGGSGLFINLSALTTNGVSSQPSSITSGTSGCNSSDTVQNELKKDVFIVENYHQLNENISRGQGEYLDVYAQMMNCKTYPQFAKILQQHFVQLSEQKNTKDYIALTDSLIESDLDLKKVCL